MFRIGVTGGIASGKTMIADMFSELGAGVVDTDLVARNVVAPGEEGLRAVSEVFGDRVLNASGELDRALLRNIVFNNAKERDRLEKILHPLIRAQCLVQVNSLQAPYALVVVPLLVETGFAKFVHRVLVVDCLADLQIQRLMGRDQLKQSDAQAMLDAQVNRTTRLKVANDVLDNNGSPDQARIKVGKLHSKYLKLAKVCPEEQGQPE
ncbi:MAG: dephospho-CoA kinase [Pseudomonadota bacterium]|nr:dephospho-CoA kinase [Pseudomonadota bacterium]